MHTYSLRVYVTLFTVLAFTAVSAVPVEMSEEISVALQEAESVGCIPTGTFQAACSQWLANAADDVPGECTNTCYHELGKLVASGCSVAVRGVFMPFHTKCFATLPTPSPTREPTDHPTRHPTPHPTDDPTRHPTPNPTEHPTPSPTRRPTEHPTTLPPTTQKPSHPPTHTPTEHPTPVPSPRPTEHPTRAPTRYPTRDPTRPPTRFPTRDPTRPPTQHPTRNPTHSPTREPTQHPTRHPTPHPTRVPTPHPTRTPTEHPTTLPPTTDKPSFSPTHTPTEHPTPAPSYTPTDLPTHNPTEAPTAPACKDVLRSDLVIAVDTSASISNDQWKTFMTFMDKLTSDFPIKVDGMHMGLQQFASEAHEYWPLIGVYEEAEAKMNMKPKGTHADAMGKDTMMHLAVDKAMSMMDEAGRANVVDVLLVITDGLPTGGTVPSPGSTEETPAAKAFHKAIKAGVKVIFVCIGWLFQFMGLPSTWMSSPAIKINDFKSLESVRGQIVKLICDTVNEEQKKIEAPPVHTAKPITGVKQRCKAPSACASAEKGHKACEINDWHNLHVQERKNWGYCAQTLVNTHGKTCTDHCKKFGLQCARAQDNVGGSCKLDQRHTRQSTGNNGCEQKWHNQVCECGEPCDWAKPAVIIPPVWTVPKKPPAPKEEMVLIGSQSGSCYKSAHMPAGFQCHPKVDKSNWANTGRHRNAQDIFEVTQSDGGKYVTVKRVDRAGQNCHGWGMNLQFRCREALVDANTLQSSTPFTKWVKGFGKGAYGHYDVGAGEFNKLFQKSSPHHIVKRLCSGCRSEYKTTYYRRYTHPSSFGVYDYMVENWFSKNNEINKDFGIFSSYEDAKAKKNAWKFCNYNDPGIGFPRDCGKTGYVAHQWNSRFRGGHSVEFYVEVTSDTTVHPSVVQAAAKPPTAKLLKGHASQSSEGWAGRPSRAIDGNTNQNYGSRSCTHTNSRYGQWWKLSLGARKHVTLVEVWNRVDCCTHRLSGVQISVDGQKCGDLNRSTKMQRVACHKTGSSVLFRMPRSDYLTLCEVKVYGH